MKSQINSKGSSLIQAAILVSALCFALPLAAAVKQTSQLAAPQFVQQPTVSVVNGQVVIQWQTNNITDTRLRFGGSANQLNSHAGEIQYTRQHRVVLAGLKYGQRYFYRVEGADPAGNRLQSTIFEFTAPSAATLNLNIEGAGKVEAPNLNCQAQCTSDYAAGKQITLVATPSTGQQFVGWSNDCQNSTNNRCTLQLTNNISVTALFVAEDAPTTAPAFNLNGSQPQLSGTGAVPGQQINLYANNTLIGTVYADENGNWHFGVTNLKPGSYQISYRYVVSGKETSPSPSLNIKINGKKRSKLLLQIIPYLP